MSTRFDDPGSHSRALFERARRVIPGGTSKANFHVRPHPFYLTEGRGCRVTDADGVDRLDAINNFTALIHGHGFPPLVDAVTRQLARGTAFAASTPEEVALAELLVERVPGLERIRFGNSGTEAVMMAIKAARAYTGRDRIAKFEGAYHGYYDDVQVSYSSGPDNWGPDDAPASTPSSGGVPKHRVQETLILPWNDFDACERLVTRHAGELAAVLVDPLANRMGFIPPAEGFLAFLRQLTRQHGVLVVFDEIISFRVAPGGAQERFAVRPDLTTLGKIIGGGYPLAAFGGRADVMGIFDARRQGAITHGGTFNGSPVAAAAGLATLRELTPDVYDRLDRLGERLGDAIEGEIERAGIDARVAVVGSLFQVFRGSGVTAFATGVGGGPTLYLGLLLDGFFLAPRGMGAIPAIATETDVDDLAAAIGRTLGRLEAAAVGSPA